MKQDSIEKRYLSRLTTNLIKICFGFATLGMVPKALGPEDFGNFSFLTNFFTTTTKLLKSGFFSAFSTKLSRRQHEKKIIGFFVYYLLSVVALLIMGTYSILLFGFEEIIWPNQNTIIICAAAAYAVLLLTSETNQVIVDSLGYTVKLEMKIILQSLFSTILIIILYFTSTLTLRSYFLLHYSILIFVIISGWRILSRNKVFIIKQLDVTKNDIISYTKEFFTYSHPLIVYSLVVFFNSIFDRWILQHYYGSEEQGYFSLAFKVAGVMFLFTSSMSTLLARDMSQSYINKSKTEIKLLFNKYVPLFYVIAVYFGAFIFLNSNKITFIIGGNEYKDAGVIISILAFYPMHQTIGQLVGGVFTSTEQTKTMRNSGISTGFVGFFLTLLLLAPIELYGFGMGAVGLAIKLVIIQFLFVNILLYKGTRFLGLSFKKFMGHQFLVILIFVSFAFLSRFFCSLLIHSQSISNFLLSGFIYTILSITIIIVYPRIIFLTRNDLIKYYKVLFN